MAKLFSIKQNFAEKIFNLEKKVEYRRQNINIENNELCIVYTSSPIKKLSGYFIVKEKLRLPLKELWLQTKDYAGITKQQFLRYFEGCIEGTAIILKVVKQFIEGIKLNDIKTKISGFRPPQSYCNLNPQMYIILEGLIPQSTIKSFA